MSTPETILERARRIAALASRGEGGERINAEKLLREFLDKHGITEADLENEQVREYRFDAPASEVECSIVAQCITSTVDTQVFTISSKKNGKVVFLEASMTPAQHAEASMKSAVMLPLFREEQRTFFHAFLFANQLLGKGASARKYTEEELARFRRAKHMSMFVKRGEVHKALEAKTT